MATEGKIDEIVEQDWQKFIDEVNSEGFMSPKQDLNKKDLDLISKMNIIAQAVVVPQPPELVTDTEHFFYTAEMKHLEPVSEPKWILIDDIYKVLSLNN